MANQTVTTSVNHDSPSVLGLLNGEQYTINGGSLTIDGDVRWGQNAAVLGNISIGASTGGTVLFDGRNVWEIPYTSPTGVVPTLGNLGTNTITGLTSGATGELITALNSDFTLNNIARSLPGASFAPTGILKLRSKTGDFLPGETLQFTNGATVVATNAGKRSWIQIVGARTTTVTIPRLGSFSIEGDWYEIGETNGSTNQKIYLPFIEEIPAVQVETSPGSGVYEWWLNAGSRWQTGHTTALSFIPTDARGKYFGQNLQLTGGSTTTGSNIVTGISTVDMVIGAPVVFAGGFADNDNLYVSSIDSDTQFRVSTNSNATGTGRVITTIPRFIEFAHRGTYNCGALPAAGCKVRIPNVIVGTTTQGPNDSNAWAGQISEGVGGDRWDLTTTAAGAVNIRKGTIANHIGTDAAFSVNVEDSALFQILANNTATAPNINNCAVGISRNNAVAPLQFANQFTGIIVSDTRGSRFSDGNGVATLSVTDCANVSLSNCQFEMFGSTSAQTRSNANSIPMNLLRCFDVSLNNVSVIGGRITLSQVTRATLQNIKYADLLGSLTTGTNGTPAINIDSTTNNVLIDGFSAFADLVNVHPFNQILSCTLGAQGIEMRNVGSPSAPYNGGTVPATSMANILLSSVSLDITMRRVYVTTTRTSALSLTNTVQNVVLDNVWDLSYKPQAIAALNITPKGCAWTNSVTGQNSVYGRHWEDAFTSSTTGRILISCNEPLPSTASQVSTVFTGSSGWTSAGNIAMANVGNSVTWEMPYYALGYTRLANTAPTITATNAGNHSFEFQYDLGTGFNGTWLPLTGANLFGIGPIDPSVGFKLRVRATVTVANSSNSLSYIRIDGTTDAVSKATQYPLPGIPLTVENLRPGSEVRFYVGTDPETSIELAGVETSSASFSTSHNNTGQQGYFIVFANGFQPLKQFLTYSSQPQTFTVQQNVDRVFENS